MFSKLLLFLPLLLIGCLSDPDAIDPESLDKWKYFTTTNGLAADFVNTICEDSNSNLWFGHDGQGLTQYDGEKFKVFTTADGLVSNSIYSLLLMKDSSLLVGTNNGLNVKFRGDDVWYSYPEFNTVSVYTIMEDRNATRWFGTKQYGIVYIKNNSHYVVADANCPPCNNVNAILEASDGKIWFGTDGGVKIFDGTSLKLYTTADGLSGNKIYSLKEDSWGNIWVGSTTGISRFHQDKFEKIDLLSDASYTTIFSIENGKPGELWIGTFPTGLIHYDGAVARKVYSGVSDKGIYKLYKDKRENIWACTFNNGVGRYTPN